MSIRLKTEFGYMYVSLLIGCREVEIATSDDGKREYVKCLSKRLKPECAECSIINPNKNKMDNVKDLNGVSYCLSE